uniref:Unannotated protein n=1 Tax=freshwater metagenome TaxID=449393 RepID=A0A6J5ZWT2_9ZZZZ
MPHPLLACIGLDNLNLIVRAAREAQVTDRLGVDREDRAGGTKLGAHVADRRPVGQRELRDARAVELDELAHHAAFAQQLGHGQDEIGRSRALGKRAVKPDSKHAGNQHRDRLPKHRRFGLDSAHAPAEHAEPVDHRRVAVGPDERVGVGLTALVVNKDAAG